MPVELTFENVFQEVEGEGRGFEVQIGIATANMMAGSGVRCGVSMLCRLD